VARRLLMPAMSKRQSRKSRPASAAANRHGLSELSQRTAEPPISWLMEQALTHPRIISLAAGFTDNPSLPVAETRAVLAELLANEQRARTSLQYGKGSGDPKLIQLTAERLRAQDAEAAALPKHSPPVANYDSGRFLITHGSQQLLYLLMEALCDPGDIVLVEDPTYFVFLGMAQSRGLRCRGVRMTAEGIDVEQLACVLERLRREGELPRVKLLYLVSYAQNPSGITTSLANKSAALRLLKRHEPAAGHPLYLLEDAAYRDLQFAGGGVASALTLPGASKRVIYTSTYSKPYATGIRVGYGVLPPQLAPVVHRLKGNHDFGTSNLLQCVLAHALESGRFASHLTALRRCYAEKAAVMGAALKQHAAGLLEWSEPQGGLYYWARLRGPGRTGPKSRIFRTALKRDVLYVPGLLCYADDPTRPKPDTEFRLSFGSASEHNIREGIARLARAIRSS
jgi:2-aminoadipate transaminase